MITKSIPEISMMTEAPSRWILRQLNHLTPGARVLDLACGSGRHARALAAAGFSVLGVDRDRQALIGLVGTPNVGVLCADLEANGWPFATAVFDGVVVSRYLHRALFPDLVRALRPGGVIIYETFMVGQERVGRPTNPDFLLQPWELLRWAGHNGLEVLAFDQGTLMAGRLAVLQRLCARRPGGGRVD